MSPSPLLPSSSSWSPSIGWRERIALRHHYPLLLDRLAEVPRAERAGTRVLDIPAGNGVLSIPLHVAGFSVVPCDLIPERMADTIREFGGGDVARTFTASCRCPMSPALSKRLFGDEVPPVPHDLECMPGDMEARLPFGDGEFDVVLCVEGIEHVPNRHTLLVELRRVLRPGGVLLLSTPNMLAVRARVALCLAGQRGFRSFLDEHTGVWVRHGRMFNGHAFLIDYFQARYSLHHAGFRIRRPLPGNVSGTSLALYPLLYPFVALFTRLSQGKAKRRFAQLLRDGEIPSGTPAPYDEMTRHVLSPELMLSSIMILEAEAV